MSTNSDLTCSALDGESISSLSRVFRSNQHLRIISFHACQLQDEQIADVLSGLEGSSSLIELDLGYNCCGPQSFTAIKLIFQHKNTRLSRLSLEYQNPTDGEHFDTMALFAALRSNRRLTYVDLSGNHLEDSDMTLLASLLLANTNLETLHLWDNNITDNGVTSFARQLPKMNGLQKLYLGNNPFGRNGTKELLEALNLNDRIQYLGLPHFTWVRQMSI